MTLAGSGPASSTADGAERARKIEEASQPIRTLIEHVGRTIVGQEGMIRGLMVGLLTGGHVLLEGVPGLAKTLTVSTLAKGLDAEFQRLQFTPDLLPADLVGTLIYHPKDGTFSARKGPIFANIVLADEINRAPAKVQSALLEAMQERQVTIGDETYPLPDPFLVLATQNPIEQEGTYPLPEAQVDRFMLKLKVDYPSRAQEREIVGRMASVRRPEAASPVVTLEQTRRARDVVDEVHVDPRILDYVVDLVQATRVPREYGLEAERLIAFGASPRASIALTLGAKAHAFLEGRAFVTPHDVKSVAMETLRHRVIVSYEAEAEGIGSDEVVRRLLDHVRVP